MEPLVSVVMSVFNGSKFMREAIDSILDQTFLDLEFIIIDDGSNDDSWDILKEYALRDNRLVLLKNHKNTGLTKSLNKALGIARGKYIARQDADDLSLPERLEKQAQFLDTHQQVVLVSSNHDRIDEKGRFLRRMTLDCELEIIKWNFLFYNYLGGHSQVMFRRDTVLAIGGYSEACSYAQDYELWIRLLDEGEIFIIREVLLKYRMHNDRVSNVSSREQLFSMLKTSNRYMSRYLPISPTLSETASLWGFWTLRYPPVQFFDGQQRDAIHDYLKTIYFNFLSERINHDSMTSYVSRSIRLLISERYIKWAVIELLYRHRSTQMKKALWYAAKWAGFRLFNVCFKLAYDFTLDFWRRRYMR